MTGTFRLCSRMRCGHKDLGDGCNGLRLEFSTDHDGDRPILHQNALFIPHGLAGHLYWLTISPFHNVVFGSMIANLAAAAHEWSKLATPPPTDTQPARPVPSTTPAFSD